MLQLSMCVMSPKTRGLCCQVSSRGSPRFRFYTWDFEWFFLYWARQGSVLILLHVNSEVSQHGLLKISFPITKSWHLCQRPSDSLHLFTYLSRLCQCHVIFMTVALSCVFKSFFCYRFLTLRVLWCFHVYFNPPISLMSLIRGYIQPWVASL